jgi:hypothetical protein
VKTRTVSQACIWARDGQLAQALFSTRSCGPIPGQLTDFLCEEARNPGPANTCGFLFNALNTSPTSGHFSAWSHCSTGAHTRSGPFVQRLGIAQCSALVCCSQDQQSFISSSCYVAWLECNTMMRSIWSRSTCAEFCGVDIWEHYVRHRHNRAQAVVLTNWEHR